LNDVEVSGTHALLWYGVPDDDVINARVPDDDVIATGASAVAGAGAVAGAAGAPCLLVADRPGSFNGTFLRLAGEKEVSAPYPLMTSDGL